MKKSSLVIFGNVFCNFFERRNAMKRVMLMTMCLVVLAGFGTVRADWTVLASDNFNRANGDLGSNWTDVVGDWKITGNEAYVGGWNASNDLTYYNGYAQFSSTPAGYQEKVDALIRLVGNDDNRWTGLAMHAQAGSTNQYYQMRFKIDTNGDPSYLQILRNDTNKEIAGKEIGALSWGYYHLVGISDNAGNMTVQIWSGTRDGDNWTDNTLLGEVSGTDASPLTGGYAGLWVNYNTGIEHWDNFTISNNVPEPATIGLLTVGLGFLIRRK